MSAYPDYTQRGNLHARLNRGGYLYAYDLLYKGEVIGSKSCVRRTRQTPEIVTYFLGDGEDAPSFDSAEKLIAAHREQLAVKPDLLS